MLLRRVLRIVWIVVLVGALGLALRSRWTDVGEQLATLDAWRLLLSSVIGLVGLGLSSGIWHAMLAGIGESLPLPASLRIFFVGQIGKYVPGAVWPAVTQAALAREHGIAPRATITAVTLFLWVHLVSGAAVGAAALVATGVMPVAALATVPLLLALLSPGVLRSTLQRLLRLARRQPLRRLPDARHLLIACAWATAMWIVYGVHLQVLTAAVGEPIGLVRAVGVFAAGWVVGFVLLIAPAGVGPREAAIVAFLPLSGAAGILVALASRLILTLADALWAGATAVGPGRIRHTQRQPVRRP
ncbi:lysylphosphatidylglycerol synthase transmembrane domain-containing protein [soil metagenome]